jgi:hypothetical protein
VKIGKIMNIRRSGNLSYDNDIQQYIQINRLSKEDSVHLLRQAVPDD